MPASPNYPALLAAAKAGDEEAHRQVALYVYERFMYRLRKLFKWCDDPALSLEDMQATFFEGIMRHVPLADGRGDDFYHIGQRGIWAVKSELRTAERLMDKRVRREPTNADGERYNPVDELADTSPLGDFREIVHSRADAGDACRVIANAALKSKTREAFELIISGRVGDPTEKGFNQRLADAMGISPQRASQIKNDLRQAVPQLVAA